MIDRISDEVKYAWFQTLVILLPIFIVGFVFGGFYHENFEESGWSIMGAVEFGRMIVYSTAGNIVFWGMMIVVFRLLKSVWGFLVR